MTEVMTYQEVKEKMARHHGGGSIFGDNMGRELGIHECGLGDSVILTLEGTPPKGYAIGANGQVSLYDVWGKRWRIIGNTRLERGE